MTKKKEEEKKRAVSQTNRLRVEAFKKVDMQHIPHANPTQNKKDVKMILKCGLGADDGLPSYKVSRIKISTQI